MSGITFTPLVNFFSVEFQSHYCVGLQYTARAQDAKLLALLPEWISEGKVILRARTVTPPAIISGTGQVL